MSQHSHPYYLDGNKHLAKQSHHYHFLYYHPMGLRRFVTFDTLFNTNSSIGCSGVGMQITL